MGLVITLRMTTTEQHPTQQLMYELCTAIWVHWHGACNFPVPSRNSPNSYISQTTPTNLIECCASNFMKQKHMQLNNTCQHYRFIM